MDLIVKQELRSAAAERIEKCLEEMEQHWIECHASSSQIRKEWTELLDDTRDLPLKFKIFKARKDINNMWEKCFKSEQEKLQFTPYHSDIFTPSLLKEHLEELQKLQQYHRENKELIGLITKYEEIWNCVLNIQQQAQNPERLFKNRGAKLLQEEQDRKLISKIPQVQNTIMKLIKKKEVTGVSFLIRGEHFAQIIERHNAQQHGSKTLKRSPVSKISISHIKSIGPSAKKKRTNENKSPNNNLQDRRTTARCLVMK